MVSGKYSALSGAIAREQSMANISENLANISTTGYRKNRVSFEAMLRGERQITSTRGINYSRIEKTYADFSQGPLNETGDPFHLAIVGDGFFKIRSAGKNYYTRNGSFRVNEDGTLVTDRGKTVLDTGGAEISIPTAIQDRIVVDGEGNIYAVDSLGNRANLGQIAVVDFDDRTKLVREEDTSFSAPEDAPEVEPATFALRQGNLEASNVNMVDEMARMIRENRYFTSYHNLLKGYSSLGEKLDELGTIS